MRYILLCLCFVCLTLRTSKGQCNSFKALNATEQAIINDLSSTLKNKKASFIVSPFIYLKIDASSFTSDLTANYGFSKHQFENETRDTLIHRKNDFLNIISPDSLLKYQSLKPSPTTDDPILDNIERQYGFNSICYFSKTIVSENNAYALVEYWIHCGCLCGYGETILMKNEDNKWIKLKTLSQSIS